MIYDCFPFFNELDLLELRLNILDPYVDFFVIGESVETFSGKPKTLFYKENKARFEKWQHKIIHVVTPDLNIPNPFSCAHYQKEAIKQGLERCNDEDIIYYGDLDEIWTPQDIPDDKVYNLRQINYSYYLNNRSSERWVGTIVGKWKTIKNDTFTHWRATHTNELIKGGWHFTNMGGLEQIKKKLAAYDHQEFNNEQTLSTLQNRMENGQDYVGRATDWLGKPFKFWIDEKQWPKYLKEHRQEYSNLIK